MKKLKLFGMFALTFALVFGVVSCSNGSKNDDLEDVLKEDVDLSGTWEITDVDIAYDIDIDGDVPADAKKQVKESYKPTYNGKELDDLSLDELIEYVGQEKTVTFATKEQAKASFEKLVEDTKKINEKFKNGPIDYSYGVMSGKAEGSAFVEMNKDRPELIMGESLSIKVEVEGITITLSTDQEVTYTKK